MTDQQREMLRRRVLGVPAPETQHEMNDERASEDADASDVRLVVAAAA